MVKVVKKVALPALAIGAVVLTGGAALGVLPALGGAGGLLASVGIKGALAGILTSAAKAATFGAVGALLTGGNPIKGATLGFVTGGALGGLSAALGGGAAAAGSGGAAAGQGAAAAGATVPGQAAINAAYGVGAPAAGAGTAATTAATSGLSSAAGLASSAPAVASAAPVASSAFGGVGNFLSQNQMLVGTALQGLGQGMAAKQDARERSRERDERRASYDGIDQGLYYLPQGTEGMGPLSAPVDGGKVRYDRRTGQLVALG